MGDDECSLLWQHLVLLCGEPVHQLSSHGEKDGAEEGSAEYEGGIVLLKTLTEHRHVAETHPSSPKINKYHNDGKEMS